jgi:hypothetical protein
LPGGEGPDFDFAIDSSSDEAEGLFELFDSSDGLSLVGLEDNAFLVEFILGGCKDIKILVDSFEQPFPVQWQVHDINLVACALYFAP